MHILLFEKPLFFCTHRLSFLFLYIWCPRRDLNPQHSASKADASANWTTRALLERDTGLKPASLAWKARAQSIYQSRINGGQYRIQTYNLRFRRPMLYPVELTDHIWRSDWESNPDRRFCRPLHKSFCHRTILMHQYILFLDH